MKKLSTILTVLFLMACDNNGGISQDTKQQELREYDAGQPVASEFQAEYSTYIWNDEPLIYVPRFGTTFDLTAETTYDVSSSELDGLDEITVEFWFNPDLEATFDNYCSTVFSFHETDLCATGDDGFYFMWQDQVEEFRLGSCYPGTGGQLAFYGTDLIEGSNHVVILTYSNKFKIFLNGVLVKEINMSYHPSSNSPFIIGTFRGVGMSYIGDLDNFAVYGRNLTTDEIIQHYAVGSDLLKR